MYASNRWPGFVSLALIFGAAILLLAAGSRPEPSDLVGMWRVDLRPTPEAAPYYQSFVVASVDGNTFEGTFYGTPVQHGRLNADWGALHFAFVTEDGSGAYHHAGRLVDGKLEGATHAVGRGFLAVWMAERQP